MPKKPKKSHSEYLLEQHPELHALFPYYESLGMAEPVLWALSESRGEPTDRKSTRLNSSHLVISYAVFCLKKKKKTVLSVASIKQLNTSHAETYLHHSSD